MFLLLVLVPATQVIIFLYGSHHCKSYSPEDTALGELIREICCSQFYIPHFSPFELFYRPPPNFTFLFLRCTFIGMCAMIIFYHFLLQLKMSAGGNGDPGGGPIEDGKNILVNQ